MPDRNVVVAVEADGLVHTPGRDVNVVQIHLYGSELYSEFARVGEYLAQHERRPALSATLGQHAVLLYPYPVLFRERDERHETEYRAALRSR